VSARGILTNDAQLVHRPLFRNERGSGGAFEEKAINLLRRKRICHSGKAKQEENAGVDKSVDNQPLLLKRKNPVFVELKDGAD